MNEDLKNVIIQQLNELCAREETNDIALIWLRGVQITCRTFGINLKIYTTCGEDEQILIKSVSCNHETIWDWTELI